MGEQSQNVNIHPLVLRKYSSCFLYTSLFWRSIVHEYSYFYLKKIFFIIYISVFGILDASVPKSGIHIHSRLHLLTQYLGNWAWVLENAGWASQWDQASKQHYCFMVYFSSCPCVPALNSCPACLRWWIITCKRQWKLSSPSCLWPWFYHNNGAEN